MVTRRRKTWADGARDIGMTVEKLEVILRHFWEFHSIWRETGQDTFVLPDGTVLNVLDLEQGIRELPTQQRVALVLTCIYNLKERDAAAKMGIRTSPVGSYKKIALRKLLERHWAMYGEGDGPGVEGNGTGAPERLNGLGSAVDRPRGPARRAGQADRLDADEPGREV